MDKQLSQSKTSRAVWAGCWIVACAASWAFAVRRGDWPQPWSFIFAYLAIGAPFIALGIWLGRMWVGLIVGLVALFVFIHFLLPIVH